MPAGAASSLADDENTSVALSNRGEAGGRGIERNETKWRNEGLTAPETF